MENNKVTDNQEGTIVSYDHLEYRLSNSIISEHDVCNDPTSAKILISDLIDYKKKYEIETTENTTLKCTLSAYRSTPNIALICGSLSSIVTIFASFLVYYLGTIDNSTADKSDEILIFIIIVILSVGINCIPYINVSKIVNPIDKPKDQIKK
jgi:membrane-associated HD superfamily phosphohydrolase